MLYAVHVVRFTASTQEWRGDTQMFERPGYFVDIGWRSKCLRLYEERLGEE